MALVVSMSWLLSRLRHRDGTSTGQPITIAQFLDVLVITTVGTERRSIRRLPH